MADAEDERPFFMRARTRVLTRIGGVAIAAAGCLLVVSLVEEPVVILPRLSSAVWRAEDNAALKGYPPLSFFVDKGRDPFRFADPPAPKGTVAKAPEIKKPPPPPPPPKIAAAKPSLSTQGLELRGVAAQPDGGGWAIVGGVGKTDLVVRKGEKIREAVVTRIAGDRIVLEKDSLKAELLLRKSFTPFTPAAAAGAKPAAAATPAPSAPSAPVAPALRQRRPLGISLIPGGSGGSLAVSRVNRGDIDIRVGDLIKSIDGTAVADLETVQAILAESKSKDAVSVELLREGQSVVVTVSLVE